MKKKAVIGTVATIAIVAISATFARFVTTPKETKEEPKTEEVRDNPQKAESEEAKLAEKKIEPTITKTPEPTKEVKPTDTAKPTATVKPTEFVKNLNPTTNKETMENRICKVFGESDCAYVVSWARQWNTQLVPSYRLNIAVFAGLIPLKCGLEVQTILGVNSPVACMDALTSDPDLSISTAKKIFDKYGKGVQYQALARP